MKVILCESPSVEPFGRIFVVKNCVYERQEKRRGFNVSAYITRCVDNGIAQLTDTFRSNALDGQIRWR